jgi:hypothetical protein
MRPEYPLVAAEYRPVFSGILMETIMSEDIQKFDCIADQITGGQQRQARLIKRVSFFFVYFAGGKSKNTNANQTTRRIFRITILMCWDEQDLD